MPFRTLLLLISGLLLLPSLGAAASFPVHTQQDWDSGSFTDTDATSGALHVASGESAGTYTSPVFDAGDTYEWRSVATVADLRGGSATVTVEVSDDNFNTVIGQDAVNVGDGRSIGSVTVPDARYVRFTYSLNGDAVVNMTNVTLGSGIHFLIRDRTCQSDEVELFSMSSRENAHAGTPGFYPYRVCASGISAATYSNICSGDTGSIISFFGSDASYTHLSTDSRLFEYKLCTRYLSIGVRDTCPGTTKAIASIYETPESHLAEPGFYPRQICGGMIQNVTAAIEFHLGPDDTIYFNSTKDPDEGVYTNPDGWGSGFLSAENESLVAGLVAGENTRTTIIGYGETGTDHLFNMTQSVVQPVSFYVPFTAGDHFDLADRRVLIARGNFLNTINPNFGLTFAQQMIVRLTLSLVNVDLVTDASLSGGAYNLIIENIGQNAEGAPQVSVNVTQ